MGPLQKHLRNTLLTGVFAAIPLAVTGFVVWYVEKSARELLHIRPPFVGVLVAMAGIYLLGLLVNSMLGAFLIRTVDRVLSRVPVLRELYQAWKHVSITPGGKEGVFAKVVLIPDETGRLRLLGFTSGESVPGDPATLCVFVPASPNPMNGRLYFAARADCKVLDLSPEEAFKVLLSTGNYLPPQIGAALAPGAIEGQVRV